MTVILEYLEHILNYFWSGSDPAFPKLGGSYLSGVCMSSFIYKRVAGTTIEYRLLLIIISYLINSHFKYSNITVTTPDYQ